MVGTLDGMVEKDGNGGFSQPRPGAAPCCPGGKMLGDVDGGSRQLSPVQRDVASHSPSGEGEEECFTPVLIPYPPSLSFL